MISSVRRTRRKSQICEAYQQKKQSTGTACDPWPLSVAVTVTVAVTVGIVHAVMVLCCFIVTN